MRKWKQKHLWIKISSTTAISFELETFEKDLFNIVDSIKFSNYKNNFQQKIDEDFAEESAK